ncbi:MAG: nucleotidyltransferase domain-containing protein [Chloroflexota bacterium]|nr:nucleotidyltransferase domain-containing protein [Chloroflexota bacterium]
MPTTNQQLDQAVDRLVKEFEPQKIVLFGSYVWGTPRPDSDIDLLVIVESSPLSPTRRAAQAYRCLQGLKIPVEVIVSTRHEIERYRSVPASLTRRILERGQVVYGQS